ncbi:MAG: exodeoxyribonuclease V subunit gamma [Propionicimonas sp.]
MTTAPLDAAPITGLRVHQPTTAEALLATLRECWSGPRADLFDFDLAVVPGPGFQRWLSQQWALRDGICAGVVFDSLAGLRRRFDADDPWRPDRLVWPLQRLAGSSDDPALGELQRHLAAAREPYSACLRIARHFAGYADHRPAMLAAWANGEEVDDLGRPLAEDAWQARLWRALAVELGETPDERRHRLLAGLREQPAAGLPHRIAVIAPDLLDQPTLELFDALAQHHQLDLLALTPSPRRHSAGGRQPRREFRRPIGHPLNDALGAAADERALLLPPPSSQAAPQPRPETLLGWLQGDLAADRLPPRPRDLAADDRSVQLHLSHGLHRQVEVLREVLAAEFAADPTLEPREIVVVTPRLDEVAPLVTATFMAPGRTDDHPGHGFRVQLADRSVAQTNPLVGLLLTLLELPDSRFEASTVLDLCAQPAVAARFGFSDDRHDRLVELVERTGVRWGLSAPQRAGFGLGQYPQNTWLAGVQRMLLGVTLDETDLVTARTVLPLDDIGSSDIELVGGLAELIGRLSRLLTSFASPATLADWTTRCRAAVESLVSLPADQQWQLADLWAGLAQLAGRGDEGLLGRHGARRVIGDEFGDRPARGSFGAGALLVCGPTSLRHVPHRVTVLLGWDAERYPRRSGRHGDDLLGREPLTGDPSAGLADRQLLLDAIHATRERLIVIARSRGDAGNEELPLAAPLQELLDALELTAAAAEPVHRRITVIHPLQPFDPGYFDLARPELVSVDRLGYRGARAMAEERPARNRHRMGVLPPPELSAGVLLDDLAAFFAHPARQLLRQRAGLSLAEPREASDALPLELDGLSRWKIGDRVLRQLRAGAPREAVEQAEWLRGELPPAALGDRELGQVFAQAGAALRRVPADAAPTNARDLNLPVEVPGHGVVGLHGRVTVSGDTLLQVEFSSLQPRHRIGAWLRLLALAAAEAGQPRAVVVGKKRSIALAAPPPAEAATLLGRYLALYRLGLSRPLPAPAWTCERLARQRRRGFDAQQPAELAGAVKEPWGWDDDDHWRAFYRLPDLLAVRADAVELPPPATGETTLLGALAQLIWAPLLEWEEAR